MKVSGVEGRGRKSFSVTRREPDTANTHLITWVGAQSVEKKVAKEGVFIVACARLEREG